MTLAELKEYMQTLKKPYPDIPLSKKEMEYMEAYIEARGFEWKFILAVNKLSELEKTYEDKP